MDPLNRVRTFVRSFDPELSPIVLETAMPTVQAAAEAIGAETGQIAKSILFYSNGRYGLFVAAGDVRIDSRVVKECLGGPAKMASPSEVEEVTGFMVGAVCPYALRTPVPVFLDQSLQRFDIVYTAAGIPESLLPIRFDQLAAITGGSILPLAKQTAE